MTNSLSRHRAISSPKEASHGLYESRHFRSVARRALRGFWGLTIAVTLVFMFSKNLSVSLLVVVLTPLSFLVARFISSRSFRLFQQQNQLPPTGETDTATWNAIAQAYRQEVRPTVLHLRLFPTGITAYAPGDKGSAVFVIQGVLQAIHSAFPAVPQVQSSGVYDTATKNAVQQFQELTPLPPSGTVDAATWNHLLAALRP